jgi:hypothetical protein
MRVRCLVVAAVLALMGCDSDDCVIDCAAECNGSPTHTCQEDCERRACGIAHAALEVVRGAE